MARDEFKDSIFFILRAVPSLHYTVQIKHRKATGLSGLKTENTDFGTTQQPKCEGRNQREEKKFQQWESLNSTYSIMNNELCIYRADLKQSSYGKNNSTEFWVAAYHRPECVLSPNNWLIKTLIKTLQRLEIIEESLENKTSQYSGFKTKSLITQRNRETWLILKKKRKI